MLQKEHSTNLYGWPVLYTSIFLMALNGFFAKAIALDAVTMTGARSILAAIVLVIFMRLKSRQCSLESSKDYVGVFGIGVLLGFHWVTYFYAMQVSTVAVGMLSLFTFPIITVLLEPFFTKKRLKAVDVLLAIVVFIGLLIMVNKQLIDMSGNMFLGVFWGVVSAVAFTLRSLLQKYKYAQVSSDGLIFYQTFAVALICFIWFDFKAVMQLDHNGWFMLVCLGIVSTAGAHTLLSYALKQLPAKTAAMVSCITPVVGALLAWWLLDEVPTLPVVAGGTLIISVAIIESMLQVAEKQKGLKSN